ncbi:MAG: hypothetical protein JO248_08535 [Acidimicrobiia bacterium]|nr:hypothetical protein [Acidimicrobiia bacterium]
MGEAVVMAGFEKPDAGSSVEQIVKELTADFDGMPVATIKRTVQGSYRELAKEARIETFLPVLTKRVARDRLRGSATSAA